MYSIFGPGSEPLKNAYKKSGVGRQLQLLQRMQEDTMGLIVRQIHAQSEHSKRYFYIETLTHPHFQELQYNLLFPFISSQVFDLRCYYIPEYIVYIQKPLLQLYLTYTALSLGFIAHRTGTESPTIHPRMNRL